MDTLLVKELAMESPEPLARLGDRHSSEQDASTPRRQRRASPEPRGELPEFYNDETPHELDELA